MKIAVIIYSLLAAAFMFGITLHAELAKDTRRPAQTRVTKVPTLSRR